jgi:hypothetical protein
MSFCFSSPDKKDGRDNKTDDQLTAEYYEGIKERVLPKAPQTHRNTDKHTNRCMYTGKVQGKMVL